MMYTYPSSHDSNKQAVEKKDENSQSRNVKHGSEIKPEAEVDDKRKAGVFTTSSDQESDEDDIMLKKGDEKKKKKRNQMTDLRFEKELAELSGRSNRKELKKKFWEGKKQKKRIKERLKILFEKTFQRMNK